MNIKMTEMNYVFDEEGKTKEIKVQYSNHNGQSNEQFYVRVVLTEGNFDEMTRSQADKEAKEKIVSWLQPTLTEEGSPAQ